MSIQQRCTSTGVSETSGGDGSYVKTRVLLSWHATTAYHHAVALGRPWGGHVDVVAHTGCSHTGAVTPVTSVARTTAPTLMLRPHAARAHPAVTRTPFAVHAADPACIDLTMTVSRTTPRLTTSTNLCNNSHLSMVGHSTMVYKTGMRISYHTCNHNYKPPCKIFVACSSNPETCHTEADSHNTWSCVDDGKMAKLYNHPQPSKIWGLGWWTSIFQQIIQLC